MQTHMHCMARGGSDHDTNPPLDELGPGGGGRPGTPTYKPQNDPLVGLIILNTHMRGF